MKNFRIIFPMLICILWTACSLIDFSEDCTYYGDVEIRPDWSELVKGDTKPAFTDVCFLSGSAGDRMFCFSGDTLVKDIQAVPYKVLAFNSYGLDDVSFAGMDCPETAKAFLNTSERNGKLYTVQAPALYAANTDVTVIPFETVICSPLLKSAIRQINIDFVVTGNTGTGIDAISGELSGIAYQYGFKQLEQLESDARLSFSSVRNKEKENMFSSHLSVFGVNPDKQGYKIDNLMDISLQTADGREYAEEIALTDIFNGFTTRIINITIEIRLGLLGMETTITGWDVSDGGNIEL